MTKNNDEEKIDIDSQMEIIVPHGLKENLEIFSDFMKKLHQTWGKYSKTLELQLNKMNCWYEENKDGIRTLVTALVQVSSEFSYMMGDGQKIFIYESAKYGWYPYSYSWIVAFKVDFDINEENLGKLDDLMIERIDEVWLDLKDDIINVVPEREEILKTAFKLHEQGNYIASIPLFIAQADGICAKVCGNFFARNPNTGRRAPDEIMNLFETNPLAIDSVIEILLEPLKLGNKLPISRGSSKSGPSHKTRGPSRHGILHGSSKHLDYGTKVNSYKAISFLAYIVFLVAEISVKRESLA